MSLSETEGSSLHVIDVATGERTERGRSSGIDTHLRWSPDGNSIAFIRNWSGVAELRVLHFPSDRTGSSTRAVAGRPAELVVGRPPPRLDDRRATAAPRAGAGRRGRQAPTDVTETDSAVVDARFSPDGDWLSFVRLTPPDGTTLRSVHAIHQRQGLRVTVSEPQRAEGTPDAHDWLGGSLAVRDVRSAGFLRLPRRVASSCATSRSPRARTGSWPGRPIPRRASTAPTPRPCS